MNKITILSRDNILFVALIFTTALFKGILPGSLYSLVLLFTLMLFYKSRKDWFWLSYAFVVTFLIGGFFGFTPERVFILGTPFYYYTVFFVVAFIKTNITKKYPSGINLFHGSLVVWLFYGLLLIFYGVSAFGIEEFSGVTGFRYYWTLFIAALTSLLIFSLPKLLGTYHELLKFSSLFFLLVYVNFIGQLFFLVTGTPIFHVLGIDITVRIVEGGIYYGELIRPEYGSNLRLISLFFALFFYSLKEKTFNKTFLLSTIFVILISTFMTATRGWIISFSFIMATFLLFRPVGGKMIKGIAVFALLFIAAHSLSDTLRMQTESVMERLLTLEALAEGDPTAGGTLSRLTDRSEPLMSVFRQYPLMGVGLSGKGIRLADQHVGNQTILMSEGIIGFILYICFFLFVFIKLININSKLALKNPHKGSLLIFLLVLLGLIIIHSSSQGFFGWVIFLIRMRQLFFIVLLFQIVNIIVTQAWAENESINAKMREDAK